MSEALIAELNQTIAALQAEIITVHQDTDVIHDYVWILASAFLVLTMQAGFALYESSLIRSKNTFNVLLKNMLDGAVGAVFWLLLGYGIAFGAPTSENSFVGGSKFFGKDIPAEEFAFFLFQYSFAATAATIMSGALAERVNFYSYLIMCGFINSLNYAFVVHWVWQTGGWLYNLGFYDFAGCGVVHMVGGFAGLAGALFIGPRIGKFTRDENGKKVTNVISMSNPGIVVLGVFILNWGWFGFNGGSTLRVSGGWYKVAGFVCLNTGFASAGGALGALMFSMFVNRKEKYVDIIDVGNGIIAGLVGITAAAPVVTFWEAFVIGILTSWAVLGSNRLIERFQILDDPVGAFTMHGVGGMCGLIWVGLFAQGSLLADYIDSPPAVVGLFYGGADGGLQLGKQLAGLIVIALWSFTMTYTLCAAVNCVVKLRVSPEDEKIGLDIVEHRLGYDPKNKGFTTVQDSWNLRNSNGNLLEILPKAHPGIPEMTTTKSNNLTACTLM